MRAEFSYGLDFGTSKTSLSCSKCGSATPNTWDVALDDQGDARTTSCVLYDSRNGNVVGVGTPAEEQYWGFLSEQMRQHYEFVANFKPHVPTDPKAAKVARDFLGSLCSDDAVKEEFASPAARICVVGRPAAWNDEAEKALVSLVRAAGLPEPSSLPEPVGALFYFLASRLTAEDIQKDILVIDWGAGTCDFSLLRRGSPSPEDSWGSSVYGGRLFDDLFFQWFVEQAQADDRSSQLQEVLAQPALAGLLREFRAREMKEEYSRWSLKPGRPFRSRIVELGKIELGRLLVPDDREFEARARNYFASKAMVERLRDLQESVVPSDQAHLGNLLAGKPVDLLRWGEDLIGEGGRGGIRNSEIQVVILAGGSTLWPWYKSAVGKKGQFAPGVKVYSDREPQLTIARGLSRAHAVGSYAQDLLDRLSVEEASIQRRLRENFLRPEVLKIGDAVLDEFLKAKYWKKMLPILRQCRTFTLPKEEARPQIEQLYLDWLKEDGDDRLAAEVNSVNEKAPEEIRRIAQVHGVHFEGLLALAAEICSPLAAERFQDWLPHKELSEQIVEAGRLTFIDFINAFFEFAKDAVGKVFGLIANAFESEEKKRTREARREQNRRDAERIKAEELLDRVKQTFAASFAERLNGSPLLVKWAAQVGSYLQSNLEQVAELSGSRGAGS